MPEITPKDWRDYPDITTPLSGTALEDLETRVGGWHQPRSDSLYSEQPLYLDFSDADTFNTRRGEWTNVSGTLPAISGGGWFPPAASGTNVMVRASEAYGNLEIVTRVTIPAGGVLSSNYGFVAKYLDSTNYLWLRWDTGTGANGRLGIAKRDLGSETGLSFSPSNLIVAAGATYWMRWRIIGNTVTGEWFNADPMHPASVPVVTLTSELAGGDATKFGAGVRGKFGLRNQYAQTDLRFDDLIIRPLGRSLRQRDVQVFTVSGTWTKPAGAAADPTAESRIIVVGAGGGGGSGARRASGTATSGGGGGQGGSVSIWDGATSGLLASGAITVPSGGAGGAAVTTNDTNGAGGAAAGNTTAAIINGGSGKVIARGAGMVAAGGGSTTTAGGGNGGVGSAGVGGTGGPSVAGANGSSGGIIASIAPGGGGGGGGLATTPAATTGGPSSFHGPADTVLGPSPAGGNGTNGIAAWEVWPGYFLSTGGQGGGGAAVGAGGNGGNGGDGVTVFGGGGGGGGASLNGSNSGAGGAGGPGLCIVITEWGG